MRTFLVLSASLLVAQAALASPPRFVEGELLVGVSAGTSMRGAESALRAHGAATLRRIPQVRVHVVKVPARAAGAVARALSRRPEFDFVEPNQIFTAEAVPNDPSYPQQWHLPVIDAPAAWDVEIGDPGLILAVLDSGVDPDHADLAPKLVPGVDTYAGGTVTSDLTGHGTKVAGSAAAFADNGLGVASPGWGVSIMPIRVTDGSGWATAASLTAGLTHAVDNGARVMNMSFAGVAGSASVRSGAQYVIDRGGVVVAASGNCGCRDGTAETPLLISVGATDQGDGLASFSSTGEYVDLSAPGVSILTTSRGGGYSNGSGTSFSSPVAAGVAALMLSVNPGLDHYAVDALLADTAVDLGTPGWDESFGHGRIDAGAALLAAAGASPPPPDTTPPTATIDAPTAGAELSGNASVSVSASDDDRVTQVRLYRDGSLLSSDSSAPFSFSWNTTNEADGTHTLEAEAYDASGNVGLSSAVDVIVANASADGAAPTVAIRSPLDGATVSRNVKITVDASDDVRVQTVEVRVDGSSIGRVSCDAAFCSPTLTWNSRKASSGSHTITAYATDGTGTVTASSPISVTKGSGSGGGGGGGGKGKGNKRR